MSFAPEDRLLLACARSELTDAGRQRVQALLESPLDWDYITEASIRHAVAPLLRNALRQVDTEVPPSALQELDLLLDRNRRRSRRIYGVLGELLDAFAAHDVAVVALKDLQLAAEVYPDPALRPIGDLDLLIPRADYEAAAAALTGLGFEPTPPAHAPALLKYSGGRHFRRARDEIWVDLQWRILEREWDVDGESPYSYDAGPLWERAHRTELGGRPVLVPSPEDMLYHLCRHLEGHAYSELILFSDLVELLQRGDVDPDRFVEVAREARGESAVWFALILAERLVGAPVPPGLLERLEPTFFRGALTAPLYGNLGSLHRALDQIRAAAAPPEGLLVGFELIARRQVARAIALEREIDRFAAAFRDEGGTVLLFGGSVSPRFFPDPAVEAFGELRALVLGEELELARRALGPGEREIPIHDGKLRLTASLDSEPTTQAEAVSNRAAGARSLGARLRPGRPNDEEVTARMRISGLEPEELVVHVAVEAARPGEERLFALPGAIELFRRLPRPPDWRRVAELARERGLQREVATGLLVLEEVLDGLPEAPLDRDGIPAPRPLEWARYGPDATTNPSLRSAYFIVLCLLLLERGSEKARYLRVLPRLAVDLAAGGIRALVRRNGSRHELAYWAAPEPDEVSTR